MLDNSAIHTKMHMLLRLFGEISCSYILEYWIIENTPLYVGLKRLFGLFEEKTKWEAFSKCPRNLRMYREIEMAQAWIMMCIVVSICTRILKYRVWKIEFDELEFLSSLNWVFTASVIACKIQVWNKQKI